ncbi:hypothetical protein [Nocardia sp. NPDC059236]|uniref:hypothetical protein n=2 Tax=unclassified Nocardia TaxID=2637762 RepID=UPI0036B0B07B
MSSIGEYFRGVRIAGLDEGVGQPDIVQAMQATPSDSSLELPTGPEGPQGETGPAAALFRWEGDIADHAALSALASTLGPSQTGKAWRVASTNALAYWNGTSFDTFADAFGAHGPTGVPNTLTVGSVTTGPAGSDLQITVTGTPPSQTVNLVVPRGIKGRKGPDGPPGPIRAASDFDSTITRTAGMVPLWNAATSKWTPVPDPSWRGPWTIVGDQRYDGGAGFAADISNSSTIPNPIATLPIPAQDTAWRPFVTGGAMLRCTSNKPAERMVLQAIISGPATIVGHGDGHGHNIFRHCTLVPSLRANAVTPGGSTGVIAAGVAATIVLQIQATASAPPYDYIRDYSHLAVWAVPVTGAPA